MPAYILVLYKKPANPPAFYKYYYETHVPLVHKIPGLKSFNVSAAPPVAVSGDAPYLIAQLEFDSMADLQAGVNSPEGRATTSDVPNFASGPNVLVYETRAAVASFSGGGAE
jgi:uncharacterized protein (TIGR02118 family)